jgi:2-haloacid dehalogenase
MYSWLLFDADGTLFDFELAEKLALQSVLEHLHQPFTEDAYNGYKRINKHLWENFEKGQIKQSEIKTQRFEKWLETLNIQANVEEVSQYYVHQLATQGPLLDGALELIQNLALKYKMLIITNGLKEVQRPRFDASILKPYFEDIIVSGEVGVAKPDAGIFDIAFEKMGRPDRTEVLIIGDSLSADMQGGLNYGIDTCWFTPEKAVTDLPITFTIHDLKQLQSILL